ncbi:MAG: Crp/Fnr family transcriptional regulator [Phyllobacteriaceae bacterium]|nr:Crp/Fnr family transcriptional regulator [Phyllobacteriaceae bacterium]
MADVAGLSWLAPEDRALLAGRAQTASLAAGTVVFSPGSPCGVYLLVLEGSIRVQMIADTGREIVLYRVRRGESCVLTTACLLGAEAYPAEGVVEEPTVGVAVPAAVFDELMARSAEFRRFVFAGYGRRVADILATMQAAVFHRVDARLARHLAARGAGPIEVTHQDLAVELGTAREVVSRHLKAFEKRGLVRLGRGTVEVVDRGALARLAAAAE